MRAGPPVVFLGPTMAVEQAAGVLTADYRPPVALGDVWRAAQERPAAIGIVDGYFHFVPAVWHREILFALAAGIPVYGAASMGALRASELAAFGMRPVGAIARDFCDGTLTADDEVVLLHATAEHDYRPMSVPLVNVRATLAAAVSAGVLAHLAADRVLAATRACHYTDRHWPALMEQAALSTADRARFQDWLPAGAVDQKQADARELLRRIGEDCTAAAAAPSEMPIGIEAFPTGDLWVELVARETPWAALQEELSLSGLPADLSPAGLAGGELPVPANDWVACWRRLRAKEALPLVPVPHDATEEDELLSWFFGERLGWPGDLEQFLRDRGWTDGEAVVAVAAREAAYLGRAVRAGDLRSCAPEP